MNVYRSDCEWWIAPDVETAYVLLAQWLRVSVKTAKRLTSLELVPSDQVILVRVWEGDRRRRHYLTAAEWASGFQAPGVLFEEMATDYETAFDIVCTRRERRLRLHEAVQSWTDGNASKRHQREFGDTALSFVNRVRDLLGKARIDDMEQDSEEASERAYLNRYVNSYLSST